MPRLPDLVRDTQLNTEITGDLTLHSSHASNYDRYKRPSVQLVQWRRGKKIGDGGQGRVYLERRVGGAKGDQPEVRAVKRIADATHRQYLHELEAIAKFSQRRYSHRFVQSFGWYEHKGNLFIAMEHMPLGDLQQSVADAESILELDIANVTWQILDGLHFMHDNDFAHRDMKPRNILVVSRTPSLWRVKIADFGISKRREEEGQTSTKIQGSIQYLAPELLQDQSPGTTRDYYKADMWAVGCITYYMITKQVPFRSIDMLFKYSHDKIACPVLKIPLEAISDMGRNFMSLLFATRPEKRPTAAQARDNPWLLKALHAMTRKQTTRSAGGSEVMAVILGTDSHSTTPSALGATVSTTISSTEMGRWTTQVQKLSPLVPALDQSSDPTESSSSSTATLSQRDETEVTATSTFEIGRWTTQLDVQSSSHVAKGRHHSFDVGSSHVSSTRGLLSNVEAPQEGHDPQQSSEDCCSAYHQGLSDSPCDLCGRLAHLAVGRQQDEVSSVFDSDDHHYRDATMSEATTTCFSCGRELGIDDICLCTSALRDPMPSVPYVAPARAWHPSNPFFNSIPRGEISDDAKSSSSLRTSSSRISLRPQPSIRILRRASLQTAPHAMNSTPNISRWASSERGSGLELNLMPPSILLDEEERSRRASALITQRLEKLREMQVIPYLSPYRVHAADATRVRDWA